MQKGGIAMLRYELKRILTSKVFIILAALSLAYFAYLTANAFRYNINIIRDIKERAEASNAFIAEITADATDTDMLYAELLKQNEENRKAIAEQEYIHKDDYDENGSRPWSEEERILYERQNMLWAAIENLDYQFTAYPKFVNSTLLKAFMIVHDENQDVYTVRLNQKIIDCYNPQKHFTLADSAPAAKWKAVYSGYYEYFYVFLAFAFVILAADVFCIEKTRSLEGMVFTSKKGRSSLFAAKLGSLIILAFTAMLIFTAADICIAYYIMGKDLLFQPIQVLEAYQISTANINFITLIILCNALRFSVLVLAIGLAAGVSQISRKVFVSLCIDLAAMFGMFAVFIYSSMFEVTEIINMDTLESQTTYYSDRFALHEKLRGFLPSCLTDPMAYFEKFDYINVADYPLTRITTCLTVTTVITILFILFAYFRYGNVLKFLPHKAKAKEAK